MKIEKIVVNNRLQENSEHDDFTKHRYQEMLRQFRPGTTGVLDVGCNTGSGGAVLKAEMPQLCITGIDCVEERLEHIGPGAYKSTICGFAHDISIPDRSFDAIVAGEIIEHIPAPFVFESLCEWFRLLRLHGRLILTTPNPNYLKTASWD